jgi:phosphoenolpyruvate phosphomutase
MQNAAKSILKHHRAHEIDEELLSIKDIITLIDEL